MITVNTWVITERAVYEGVALGVQKAMKDPELAKKPEAIIDAISQTVMDSLSDVFDFGIQPVRFTPQHMQKLWDLAKQDSTQES